MSVRVDLAGLPIPEALAKARRELDAWFLRDLERQEEMMRADGLDRETRTAMLDDQRLQFADWRENYLTEIESRLLARAGRLN